MYKRVINFCGWLVIILWSCCQTAINDEELYACREKWEYKELSGTGRAVVLFYKQPGFTCGVLSNASVAIVQTEQGDTIRVLTPVIIKTRSLQTVFIRGWLYKLLLLK